ncbi:MAG TPA: glycosyltransferase [Steroidobacteraceae bacterium]
MQVLIITFGSSGDLLPLLSIAHGLKTRGHDVGFAGSSKFSSQVRANGFDFNSVFDAGRVQVPLEDARQWDLNRIWALGWERVMAPAMRPTYELIQERMKRRPCVVLAHWVAFGARLAAEKLGTPLCTVYFSPEVLNACDTDGPRWRRFSEDEVFGPLLNEYRKELGLAPVQRIASEWLHSPRLGLALFPEWFCARRACWPAQATTTGFVTFDEHLAARSDEALEAFLDGEAPPIVFTPGTGMPQASDFFRESLAACASMARRAILLTPHRSQLPPDLPPWALHVDYVPLHSILPRTAALVHHGGIGTCAQAIRAATPQLVAPIKGDQFDNAQHVRSLGLGVSVPMKEYEERIVTRELAQLLGAPTVRESCDALASRFAHENSLEKACEVIETLG